MTDNPLARQFTALSLLRFSLPNICMMVFMSLYTIVDGMFIARFVGTLEFSATNMSYPLTCFELALGIMISTGASAIVAKELGEGREREAREDFTCVVAVAGAAGVVLAVAGNLFLEPILRLLGTSAAQMPACLSYTSLLVWMAPMSLLQSVFLTLFVTAGRPDLGLWSTVCGGVVNVVLDYVFMGPLDLGITGAAAATGLGYSVPALTGLWFFAKKRGSALYFVPFPVRWRMLWKACGNGSSEMVSNLANGVTTFLFNLIFMEFWGEDGVASISIALYFQFVFTAIYGGFAMGVAPVVSYKYGARDTDQLRRIVRYCIRFLAVCSLGMYALSLASIGTCLRAFTDPGTAVYEITLAGFPLFAVSFLFMGVNFFASALFTAFSDGTVSAVISFGHTLVFLVASLLILPRLFAGTGVWAAVPVAEFLGMCVSIGFLLRGRRKYGYG